MRHLKHVATVQAVKTLAAFFVPFYYSARASAWSTDSSFIGYAIVYGVMFVGWVVFVICSVVQRGIAIIGWILYVAYALHTAYVRAEIRGKRVRWWPC